MYAPVATRFLTYDVKLDPACAGYCRTIMQMPEMIDWVEAAKAEPVGIYGLASRGHGESSVVTEDEATAEVIEMAEK